MHVLIIGAAGMVGRKLTERLAKEGRLGEHPVARMTLHDVIEPASPKAASFAVETLASDFSAPGETEKLPAFLRNIIEVQAPPGEHSRTTSPGARGWQERACGNVLRSRTRLGPHRTFRGAEYCRRA